MATRRSKFGRILPALMMSAALTVAVSACKGRGPGTGQPYYGPGTGPIGSFVKNGNNGLNSPEFLYWVNAISNDIAIYAIDSTTGCISPLTSNNVSTGPNPLSIAAHPDPQARLMYVGCSGSGDILSYHVDQPTKGNLQPTPTTFNISNIGNFRQMRFKRSGDFLYVLTDDPNLKLAPKLSAFTVDKTTAALAAPVAPPGKTIQSSISLAQPTPNLIGTALCLDTTDKVAYVTLNDGQIVGVNLDQTGNLSLVQQTSSTTSLNGTSAPTSIISYLTYLYEGGANSSNLDFISVSAGVMTLNNNTFASGGQLPVDLEIPNGGGALFQCNGQPMQGNISCFTLSGSNGVLGPNPLPPPVKPGIYDPMTGMPANGPKLRGITTNFTGTFLYSMDNGYPPPPPPGPIPAEVSCWAIANGVTNPITPPPAPPTGPAGPTGQPFTQFVIQKGNQWGEPILLCPDAMIVNHTP